MPGVMLQRPAVSAIIACPGGGVNSRTHTPSTSYALHKPLWLEPLCGELWGLELLCGVSGSGGPPVGSGSGSVARSVAGVEKKPVSWHKDVCRGEEGRHMKTQLLPSLMLLHTGTRRQLGLWLRLPGTGRGCLGDEPPAEGASLKENTYWILVHGWNGV